jgi:hypothetical protein
VIASHERAEHESPRAVDRAGLPGLLEDGGGPARPLPDLATLTRRTGAAHAIRAALGWIGALTFRRKRGKLLAKSRRDRELAEFRAPCNAF